MMNYRKETTDVLVIGGGIAGIRSALACCMQGLKVRILSKGPKCTHDISGFNAPVGSNDSPELFEADINKNGRGINDPKIAYALAYGAGKEVGFLEELGVEFDKKDGRYDLLQPLACSVPRLVHTGTLTGDSEERAILAKLSEYGAFVETGVKALELVKINDSVCGAVCIKDGELTVYAAKAVVMASGGCSGLYELTTYNKALRGDGIAMAYRAGAEICDLDLFDKEPCCLVRPEKLKGTGISSTMLFEGGKLFNSKGESVIDKYFKDVSEINKRTLSAAMLKEIELGNGIDGALAYDFSMLGREEIERHEQLLPLLEKNGLDPCSGPIYVAPAMHTTLGGIKTDAGCQSSVKGLFACGEAMGGVHGASRIGGDAGTEVLVFGGISGESASAFAKETKLDPDAVFSAAEKLVGDLSAEDYEKYISELSEKQLWSIIEKTASARKNTEGKSICISTASDLK